MKTRSGKRPALALAFALAALVAMCGAPFASAQTPSFQRIPDAAGLSHNTVHTIAQDGEGFLWVGTADGLNRFDGYEFKVYRPGGESGLSGSLIWDLLEDSRGEFWVLTGDGIDRYDRASDRFATVDRLMGSDLSQAPGQLYEDSRGTLWVATSGGLYARDFAASSPSDAFATVPVPGLRFRQGGVVVVQEGPTGKLWVKGPDGRVFDVSGETPPRPGEPASAFLIDSRGRFLQSLEQLMGDRGLPLRDTADPSPPPVWAIHENRDGTIWFGTGSGLVAMSRQGALSPLLPVNSEGGQGYVFDFVRSLFEDRAGTLWVGTHGGLFRLDPNAKEFAHLEGDPNNPTKLSGSAVSSIEETSSGIWIGTLGAGVNRVDPTTGLVERLPPSADPGRQIVWALREDPEGRVWVGSSAGLDVFQPGTSRPQRYEHEDVRSVQVIENDGNGGLWLASSRRLLHVSAQSTEVSVIPCCGEASGESGRPLESLLVGRDHVVWVGVGANQLFRYDPASGDSRLVSLDADVPGGLGIWDIFEDELGVLWLGMGTGLGRYDPTVDSFRMYSTEDGLPGSVVFSVTGDPEGRIWLGTNQGLTVFDPTAVVPAFRTYGLSDGVGNLEFNRRAVAVGLDGRLHFGGMNGLTSFRPEDIHPNPVPPPIVFTSIETVGPDGARRHPTGAAVLNLSHRENTVSFEFSALSFTNSAANRYRYRLSGADAEWVEAGDRRYARYAGLPAGQYVFAVLGSNEDGVWSPEESTVRIVITPPWWQRTAVRVGFVLASLLLLSLAYRTRVLRLLAVERMRLSIAGDLHDELASDLSGIALIGESLQKNAALDKSSKEMLGRISASARRMVNDVRDIVWAVDPTHDSPTDLADHLREVARTMLGEGRFTFRASLDSGDRSVLGMDVRRQILLICKEALHNSARHAQATAVDIVVNTVGGAFQMRISDDGVGFDPDALEHRFGLDQLHRRARSIGGSVRIRSRPGEGTIVTLTVPR